jgi:hypothetical protein
MHRVAAFALALLVPGAAFAQSSGVDISQVNDDEVLYKFTDGDGLHGVGIDVNGALITVRPPPGRVYLIRPRASFVPELQKSVEKI